MTLSPWQNRHMIAEELERATLNWFAMGAKPDSEWLAKMRHCYEQLLDIDTMMSVEAADAAELDEGRITIPVTRELKPDEGRTFTVEGTCAACDGKFTLTGQVLMVGGEDVVIRTRCPSCSASGEYVVKVAEFDRLFPRPRS